MSNLEKLYQSIANLKELGLPLHEETLKAVDNLEEELIKNEIIPRLSESIEAIITQIQRPIVLVVDYIPNESLSVRLTRKRVITDESETKQYSLAPKTKDKLLIYSLLVIFFILGCEKENPNGKTKELTIKNLSFTDCKDNSQKSSSTFSCLNLNSKENNYLEIQHLNTMFCCGTKQVEIKNEIKNDTIFITETDLGPYTYCYCRHDLFFEIGPLEDKSYVLKIIGCETSYNRDTIIINFQYSNNLDFSNCN
jgi:hypothetical protein